MVKRFLIFGSVAVLAVAAACGDNASSPVSPSASNPAGSSTAAYEDGATLKVTIPGLVSPANNATTDQVGAPLVVTASTGKFAPVSGIVHRFEVVDPSNRVVSGGVVSGTSYSPAGLQPNTNYRWRARGEAGSAVGPWSQYWSFRTPDKPQGYIRGSEVYDPLTDGTSVGTIVGSATFIPGVGLRLNEVTSHIAYQLQEPLVDGEFSLLATNVATNTEANKTKIMSMQEGSGDITTNRCRMTYEKRGDPAGDIAWRFIPCDLGDEISTVGAERVAVELDPSVTYLWRAEWRGGFFNASIIRDGANGATIYNFGKPYRGTYRPNPHRAYVGAPVGRGGPADATVPGMIVRQVWISSQPRPAFANQ